MSEQHRLFNALDEITDKLNGALATNANLVKDIEILRDENTWLREQISELKRSRFGRKSERFESPEQGCLFNEAEIESKKPEVDGEGDVREVEVKGHTKKIRGHRKALPDHLEREIIKLELPEEERFDDQGTPLKIIGWETSEKLKYEPAKVSVIQTQRAKYGVDVGDYVKTAPPLPSILPKSNATPELLSAIVTAKYADGLPLYRMEEFFKRQDIELGRTTMARWMIQVAEACRPVLNVLSDRWRESFYVALDETKVQVLKEKDRKAESKSWMIVRSTPFGEKKIVLFDYNISRSTEVMNEILGSYKGFMQVDGLNVYDEAAKTEGVIRLGCAMHARRRFESALVDGAKAGKSLGEVGMKYFKDIYEIEEELRESTPEERYRIRLEKQKSIWDEMHAWAKKNRGKAPEKSKIGDAFRYLINEYDYLTNYLLDGRLEIDNGFTERAIRKFAIGRNSWLFSDQVEGANASALLYSLVITAKVNNVNPYRALVKLFEQLPYAKSDEDYARLADLILIP